MVSECGDRTVDLAYLFYYHIQSFVFVFKSQFTSSSGFDLTWHWLSLSYQLFDNARETASGARVVLRVRTDAGAVDQTPKH